MPLASPAASEQSSSDARPLLLLMKGHPGSGKSTLAHAVASALRWPLVDKDDIRDATLPLELPLSPVGSYQGATPNPPEGPAFIQKNGTGRGRTSSDLPGQGSVAEASGGQTSLAANRTARVDSAELNALSYQAMWNVAARQLALGLSVVVDCPLAHQWLFMQGQDLASRHGARVAVLECHVSDEAEWRRRVEERASEGISLACSRSGAGIPLQHPSTSEGPRDLRGVWHKPSTWADVVQILERYNGCWKYDLGQVPHLVLDTGREATDACLVRSLQWLQMLGYPGTFPLSPC